MQKLILSAMMLLMVFTQANAAEDEAMRASCLEFVLAGLYSMDMISRAQHHGTITYRVE